MLKSIKVSDTDLKRLKTVNYFRKKVNLKFDNFLKKETLAHVFSCEFCEISKTFFTEHLWATASVYSLVIIKFFRFFDYLIVLNEVSVNYWQNIPTVRWKLLAMKLDTFL